MSFLRNRFGVPGAISVIALLFAMTGGAFAAKYVITSTKQIKPSVRKALQGKAGPQGPQGPAGPQGPQGAQGGVGPAGATGKAGANGVSVTATQFSGAKGDCLEGGVEFKATGEPTFACNGEPGEEGSPWTAGGTLPDGATETGVFSSTLNPKKVNFETEAEENSTAEVWLPASFTLPLAGGLSPELVVVKPGESGGTKCPGLVAGVPAAEEGVLCVYVALMTNATFIGALKPNAQLVLGTEPTGAVLAFKCTGGSCRINGSWAVTG